VEAGWKRLDNLVQSPHLGRSGDQSLDCSDPIRVEKNLVLDRGATLSKRTQSRPAEYHLQESLSVDLQASKLFALLLGAI